MVGRVVILSGPPGAGKTTVARALLAGPAPPTAYIEGDSFWAHFQASSPLPPPVRFKALMTAALAAALSYALHDADVLLDFSVPPHFLETALRMAKTRGVPLAFVVLLPSAATCEARTAERPDGKVPVGEYAVRFGALRDAFDATPSRHVVGTRDGETAEAVAVAVRAGLERGDFGL